MNPFHKVKKCNQCAAFALLTLLRSAPCHFDLPTRTLLPLKLEELMKRKLNITKWAITACTVTALQSAFAVAPNDKAITAEGVRNFGFNAVKSLHNAKGKVPVALSPYSLVEVLTLATLGSEAGTKKEMESLFLSPSATRSGASVNTLVSGVSAIRTDLANYAKDSDGAFEFSSANALWGNTNAKWEFQFQPQFLKRAKNDFGAEAVAADFGKAQTLTDINAWVAKATKDKIKDLLKQLKDEDVAVLLNGTYAKGKFLQTFDKIETKGYTKADGTQVQASFMSREAYDDVYEDSTMRLISIAIGDEKSKVASDQIALDIITHPKNDLNALVNSLDGKTYAKAVASAKGKQIILNLPAGKVEQEEPLKMVPVFKAAPFNISIPFDKQKASFGLLGTTKRVDDTLYISDIVTKTFYEVTPFGFEAAAASAVLISAESASISDPPVEYSVTGPSIHVVRHVATGMPLFITVYDSPTLYSESEILDLVQEGEESGHYLGAITPQGKITVVTDPKTGKRSIALVDATYSIIKVYRTL
jgi:serpin B